MYWQECEEAFKVLTTIEGKELEDIYNNTRISKVFLEYSWEEISCITSRKIDELSFTNIKWKCSNLLKIKNSLDLNEDHYLRYLWKYNCEFMIDKKEKDKIYNFYKEGFSLNQVIIISIISIFIAIIITSLLWIFIYKKTKKV